MQRRTFLATLAGTVPAIGICGIAEAAAKHYDPTWASIETHQTPQWYDDAKLGIFIHWGLYSVPAWAPPSGELGKVDRNKWFYENPYAEWYLNSLRLKDTPTYRHHVKTYGANFDYYNFSKQFNRDTNNWQPAKWAKLFQQTGARYVVLTTKHHDGFTLWPSRVTNPHKPAAMQPIHRDLPGELTKAVRAEGMKMGLYYSGGLDWTFTTTPIAKPSDLMTTAPQTAEYANYADSHWRELIDRYQPAVMWNDITYPKLGKLTEIFSDYYNRVPDGVIDNRFGVKFADFTTPEYAKYEKITQKKWESCRGLGFSFGYNRVEGPEQVIAPDKLIALVVDIVSKNGNLLLNVGPRADGSISEIQLDRLHKLGAWMAVNGDGIYSTQPWVRPSDKTSDGVDVRYTRKGNSLYVFLLSRPQGSTVTIPRLHAADGTRVTALGGSDEIKWKQNGNDLSLEIGRPAGEYALGLKLTPAPRAA